MRALRTLTGVDHDDADGYFDVMSNFALELFHRLLAGGESEILAELQRPNPEHAHLDFKRVATPATKYARARGASLDDSDRTNLGKAISGFANSLGGVIVWGIDCVGNSPAVRVISPGIEEGGAFKGTLRSLLGKACVPGLADLRLDVVPLPSLTNRAAVLMYVPRSEYGPVQATIGDGADKFYFRVGDDFRPVTYDLLASMFGRTPPPVILRKLLVSTQPVMDGAVFRIQFDMLLRNHGQGLARRPFLTLMMSSPGDASRIHVEPLQSDKYDDDADIPHFVSLMAKEEHPLPPYGMARVARFTFAFQPPFTRAFDFDSTVGAEGALPRTSNIRVEPQALMKVYRRAARRKTRLLSQLEAWSLLAGTP